MFIGYFMETIRSDYAYIEHKTFMHQKYIRLYVIQLKVNIQSTNYGGGYISLEYPEIASEDITFNKPIPHIGNW